MAISEGTNAGFVTSAPSSDPSGSTGPALDALAWASRFTSPSGSNAISSIGWYCDTASEESNYQVGIYSHDAVNCRPNALLASSGDIAKGTGAGWKTGSVEYNIDASTVYWITAQLDNTATTTNMNYHNNASYKTDYVFASSLPSSWGSSSGTYARIVAIYALYAAAGGGSDGTVTVSDPTSSSTLDAIVLTQAHALAIAELASSSSLDAPAMVQRHLLAIAELLCSSTLDATDLTQQHLLAIQEALSGSSIDAATLTQAHSLLVQELQSESTIDNISLSGLVLLVIQDLVSSSTLDAPALTQAHNISIADLTSSDTLDGDLTLSQKCYLVIQELTSSGLIDAVVLSQAATLVIQSLLSGSSIDAPVLTQAHRLTASNLESAGTIDNITLSQLHQLIIDALTSSSELDNIVFIEAMIALYILLSLAVESTSKITTGPQDIIKANPTKDIQLIVH
jgi:hypothetical protein